MSGVVAEAARRHAASDRFLLGWNQRVNATPLEPAVDLGIRVTGISRDRLDRVIRDLLNRIDLGLYQIAFVHLSGRYRNVENHAPDVVDRRVLLVARLKTLVPRRSRHARIRIRPAHLLVLAALSTLLLRFDPFLVPVLRHHLVSVTLHQALPAHIGADQRRVDVHHLGRGNLRFQTHRHRRLKDPPEPRLTPTLADPRQARMVRQTLVQAVTNEPADRKVHLRFPHQSAVVHNPEQQAGKHQTHRNLRIDARSAIVDAIAVRHFLV